MSMIVHMTMPRNVQIREFRAEKFCPLYNGDISSTCPGVCAKPHAIAQLLCLGPQHGRAPFAPGQFHFEITGSTYSRACPAPCPGTAVSRQASERPPKGLRKGSERPRKGLGSLIRSGDGSVADVNTPLSTSSRCSCWSSGRIFANQRAADIDVVQCLQVMLIIVTADMAQSTREVGWNTLETHVRS